MKKTRYLDHIDLRVTDLKRAHKFYSELLPALGFIRDRSSRRWGIFYAAGGNKPEAFFGFTQDRHHQPNDTRIAFWAESRAEVDQLARLVRKIGEETWRAQSFVVATARAITPSSSKTWMTTNWKSAVAKILSSPNETQPQDHKHEIPKRCPSRDTNGQRSNTQRLENVL